LAHSTRAEKPVAGAACDASGPLTTMPETTSAPVSTASDARRMKGSNLTDLSY
jgi:hypothetical protein